MTTDEIRKEIERIKSMAADSESAHSAEDALRAQFIAYVASVGIPSLAEKARLVLSTDDIEFERWCA